MYIMKLILAKIMNSIVTLEEINWKTLKPTIKLLLNKYINKEIKIADEFSFKQMEMNLNVRLLNMEMHLHLSRRCMNILNKISRI